MSDQNVLNLMQQMWVEIVSFVWDASNVLLGVSGGNDTGSVVVTSARLIVIAT